MTQTDRGGGAPASLNRTFDTDVTNVTVTPVLNCLCVTDDLSGYTLDVPKHIATLDSHIAFILYNNHRSVVGTWDSFSRGHSF